MKLKMLSLVSFMCLSFSANAVCPGPRENVRGVIDEVIYSELTMPYCYVSEFDSAKRYLVEGCENVSTGDQVVGQVSSFSLGLDERGYEKCHEVFEIR